MTSGSTLCQVTVRHHSEENPPHEKTEKRTIACEAKDVPPRFAKMGALRWMRANVVMNGAEPCAMRVRIG